MIDRHQRRALKSADSIAEDAMTPKDQHILQIMMEEAKIELPVKFGLGFRRKEIVAANRSMFLHDEGGHTLEQAKYIAHLLNEAPRLLAEIDRLRRENQSYRNYIASAPNHGAVDYE